MSHRQLYQYHPVIGHRFIPDVRARIAHEGGGFLWRTNSAGFRSDHEFASVRTPGTRRVLVFGDSFTAGDGVSNGKRFSDVVESLIPGIEVFNFGLSGTGTDQQYLVYREFAEALEHDLVVIVVQVENIRRVAAAMRMFFDAEGREALMAKPYFEIEGGAGGELVLKGVPVRREPFPVDELTEQQRGRADAIGGGGAAAAVKGLVTRLGLKDVAQKFVKAQPLPEYDRADSPQWVLLSRILEMWAGRCRAPVLVVPLPVYQYVEGTAEPRYRERFGELAARLAPLGAAVHDPLDDLLTYSAAERRAFRFATDQHPTAAGHEAIAKSLAPAVSRALERPDVVVRPAEGPAAPRASTYH